MPPIQQKTPRTRIQGRAVVETLCDCPGHPHNFHTTEVEVDQVVVEDGRKDMPIKALKDHFGKKRWREVASHTWSVGPTLTPLQPVGPPLTEEQKTAAALSTERDAFLTKLPASRPLLRAIGISIDPDANGRSFTVEAGHIDPAAVPLSEMLKLGPNAGLLADLVDSLFADPKGST